MKKKLKASNQFLMHNKIKGNWSIRWILGSLEKWNIESIFSKMNKICAMRYTPSDSRIGFSMGKKPSKFIQAKWI